MSINVMIVDDSIFIRAMLKQMIENDPNGQLKVVASAKDGEDALKKLQSFDIDVITMDVEMPKKNGIEAVKEIMQTNPKPIIMLSSLTKKGAKETIEALSYGAIDFIAKPEKQIEFTQLKTEICEKLTTAVKTKQLTALASPTYNVQVKKPTKVTNEQLSRLIVLGCSTGGPKALQKIIAQIPRDFQAGMVIVQHMPEGGYTASLANHLNNVTPLHVKEAEDGEEVKNGTIYIAPGGFHTELFQRGDKIRIVLNKRELVTGHRPSVDVLFESTALIKATIPLYGVVLTGMGSDGSKGARSLRQAGATIIAESEETAIIYGMPKQVVQQNLADEVLRLEQIIPYLYKKINS